MKLFTASLILTLLFHVSIAQDVTVTGTITDSDGNALDGITVTSSLGSTFTDIQGKFEIRVTDTYQSLTFSGSGFQSQTIPLNGQTQINSELSSASSSDQMVETGFGTQSKKSSTSSVAQISGSALNNQPVVDIEQSSQGRAAGVFVQNNGGKLGEGTKVRIRGGSSLSGSNEPLYVVDGVPLTSNNQSDIDPSLIESMEILKDAAATSLYGSRAANGVVIITTKKGKSGKLKVDVDYQFGVSMLGKRLDMMTPEEYNQMFIEYTLRQPIIFGQVPAGSITQSNLERWSNESKTLNQTYPDSTYQIQLGNNSIGIPLLSRLNNNTDWQDLAFRTAISNRGSINLSGGSKNHQVFANVNYLNQDGILIGNNYERFGGRVNLNSSWTDRLSSNISFSYVKTNNNKLNEDADVGNPVQMVLLPPSDAPDPENSYILDVRSAEYNPQTEVYNSLNFETSDRMNGNIGLAYELSNNLSLNLDGGIDYLDLREERRQGPATQEGNPTGLSRLSTTNLFNYLVNGYLDYHQMRGTNELNVILGGSYQNSNSTFSFRRARINSISDLESLNENDPSLLNNPVPGSAFSFLSAYTRANYSINGKYHFQASARMDGSSKFGSENQYGIFPAASAGWTLSEESFLKGNPTISFLKLRSSYGLVGNTPEDDFLYRNNYYTVNYGVSDGIRLANLGNQNLKWETTAQLDVGLEFGFFGDRLFGSLNYYRKNTTDLLFPVPVSQTSGFGSVIRNVGTMVNTGFELTLSSLNVSSGAFEWTTDFNISTNSNEIKDLGGQRLISGVNAFIEGEAAGTFYMVDYAGVDPATGNAQYEDQFGFTSTNYDQVLVSGRKVAGNPNPKFFGGMTNNLSYGNLSLNFTFQFVQGIDLYWETGELIANSGFGLYGQTADQVDRWYQPGDNANYPAVNPNLENTNPSSRWLYDGSYIRLNNLNISYDLTSQLSSIGISNCSIYVGGQNLFTITSYPGYDPDVSYTDPNGGTISQNINRGIDLFSTPQPRVFITGLKIGF